MEFECRRCLLNQTNPDLHLTIRQHIANLDSDIKCSKQEYENRLETCRSCKFLVNGMCVLCGCFVEMRAATAKNRCADTPEKW